MDQQKHSSAEIRALADKLDADLKEVDGVQAEYKVSGLLDAVTRTYWITSGLRRLADDLDRAN